MASTEEREKVREVIAVKLSNAGYTEKEVNYITESIMNQYNGLPLGWIDLVDFFVDVGYSQEEALKIVYLVFKAIRHNSTSSD